MPPPCPGSCTLSAVLSEGVQDGNLQGPPQSHCVPLQGKDKFIFLFLRGILHSKRPNITLQGQGRIQDFGKWGSG